MNPVVENGITGKKIKNPSSRAKLTTGQANNFMNPVVENGITGTSIKKMKKL